MDPDDDVNPFDDETEEAGAMRAGGLGDLLGGLLGGGAASGTRARSWDLSWVARAARAAGWTSAASLAV